MWPILILLLCNNGNTCESLIWILLLSSFCGDNDGGCPNSCPTNSCPGTSRCPC